MLNSCQSNNYKNKMWGERSPNQRASRVAIAGSIYMRRASLQAFKPKQFTNENLQNSIRNPSFGKIVKNGQNTSKKYQSKFKDQIPPYSRKVTTPSPLVQKNNIISNLGIQFSRKTPTPSFGQFEEYQNTKIKAIEDKYRTMLSDYQTKKKNINSQLASLKSSMQIDSSHKKKQFGITRNRIDVELSKPQQTTKINKQYESVISDAKKFRQNEKVYEYQIRSKQLMIEKLSSGSKVTNSKKKQKVTDLYPKFFKAIKNQLLLEEQLRNIKTSVAPQKKPQVQKILSQTEGGRYLKILQTDPEQFDPFQNKKVSQLSAEAQTTKLIQKYKECEQNWSQSVCNLSKRQARQIFDCLNFEKGQQITLKSFVRQMSFLIQKHLRNRDLLRIYHRLAPLTQNNFCQITSNKQ